MKKFKRGFSLAEILIALGIVAVIATMGFTIAQQGIARAYDMYIYTGYKGISDAMSEAFANGLEIPPAGEDITEEDDNGDSFAGFIANILNSTEFVAENADSFRINTPNNIRYIFSRSNLGTEIYSIRMDVPAKRTRNNDGINTVCLLYRPSVIGILVPVPDIDPACTTTIRNIMTRQDLLPFYIDNGTVGRVNVFAARPNDPASAYTPRTFYSISEALCRNLANPDGSILSLTSDHTLSCNEVLQNERGQEPGVITVRNPRLAN